MYNTLMLVLGQIKVIYALSFCGCACIYAVVEFTNLHKHELKMQCHLNKCFVRQKNATVATVTLCCMNAVSPNIYFQF